MDSTNSSSVDTCACGHNGGHADRHTGRPGDRTGVRGQRPDAASAAPAAPAPSVTPAAPAAPVTPGATPLKNVIHPGEGVFTGAAMSTRRAFAAAAAATTAAAALGIQAARATDSGDGTTDGTDAAEDGSSATGTEESSATTTSSDGITVTDLLSYQDLSETLTYQPDYSFDLPLGSLPSMDGTSAVAIVRVNDSARPLTVIDCLDIANGIQFNLLSTPVSGTSYAPSECHMSSQLVAWAETDNSSDAWNLYAAPYTGTAIAASSAVLLASGDSDWLPVQFSVWEDSVVWQLMPDPTGPYVTGASTCFLWRLGWDADSAQTVWSSPGQFGCAPDINAGIITISPRVNASQGTYYGITALDIDDTSAVLDQLVLPASIRPFYHSRIGGSFAFSIEANYGYGGTFGNMGTYIGPGSGPFLALQREPSAPVNYVNNLYIIRSQLSYFVFDLAQKTYTRLRAVSGSSDYGDYPATSGTSGVFVTYAMVKDGETGLPSRVITRVFSLT